MKNGDEIKGINVSINIDNENEIDNDYVMRMTIWRNIIENNNIYHNWFEILENEMWNMNGNKILNKDRVTNLRRKGIHDKDVKYFKGF